jgi:hypothetical protein
MFIKDGKQSIRLAALVVVVAMGHASITLAVAAEDEARPPELQLRSSSNESRIVAAQVPKRIEFAKGKSSATVRGTTGPNGATYSVRARSGQMLVLTLSPESGVGIKVENIGRFGHTVLLREEQGGTYQVGLEENGEYTIFLGATGGKSAAFTLSVRIVRMTDI